MTTHAVSHPQRDDTSPRRVIIADDHPPTRAWIRDALASADMVVVGEVGNGSDAVALAARQRPDICVLDIHMPYDGITAACSIVSDLPCTCVIILTASLEDDDLFAALRAGASGYLIKHSDPEALRRGVQAVSRGEARLPQAPFVRLLERNRSSPRRWTRRQRDRGLSPEERLVLELLADGRPACDIARHLPPGQTVRASLASGLDKLGYAPHSGRRRSC